LIFRNTVAKRSPGADFFFDKSSESGAFTKFRKLGGKELLSIACRGCAER
jgi:hypothetical protein